MHCHGVRGARRVTSDARGRSGGRSRLTGDGQGSDGPTAAAQSLVGSLPGHSGCWPPPGPPGRYPGAVD